MTQSVQAGVHELDSRAAAEHLVRVAVGRDSSVIAEDQILHQLRRAAHEARGEAQLTAELDRLLDLSLRAGRRARSWLPARRPTLVDLAIERANGERELSDAGVLVVGTGEMGRAAAAHLARRHARVHMCSRTLENAQSGAPHFGAVPVAFDPGSSVVASVAGVVVALSGPWPISPETSHALIEGGSWVVDVSSPPALAPDLAAALAGRLLTIDDLASPLGVEAPSARLVARLDSLVEETVDEFERWAAAETRREAAQALSARAHAVRSAELERLWRKVPSLDADERAEVERALDHFTETLLREPLEQLGRDADDRHVQAARELFRL